MTSSTVLLLSLLAYRYTGVWADGDRLWAHVAERFPGTATAYGNRGMWLRERGRSAEAMALFTRAIEADPRAGTYYNSRGKLHFDEGRTPAAIADYTAGIAAEPTWPRARVVNNLVRVSKGEMTGVKYNKDKDWVGASVGLHAL